MNKNSIYEWAEAKLTEKRKKHTEGVIAEAIKLAKHYGEDVEKAEIASLCHDIFRGRTLEETNTLIEEWSLPKKYIGNVNLAHGKLAAYAVEKEIGIKDRDLLNAISFHTTGRPQMSLLEKIIFIADSIEPGRDFPGVDELKRLAYENIDAACLASLRGTLRHLREQGVPEEKIDDDTVEAEKYFAQLIEKEK